MNDVTHLTLREARDSLRAGDITAEALVTACLARIEETEPRIGALLARRDGQALEEARACDRERAKNGADASRLLWGVPVTVKDVLTLAGSPTTGGSRILANFVPVYDAFVVTRLKEAGAIILAKNNMDEFAMGSSTENSAWHPTRNPWDRTCVPGGSSGGSAASVAACQCFASLGSDTGGSIRQPATLCGCVGLKPTYSRVSRYGMLAYASSLDQVGPLARSVEDVALLLKVIAGHDERDSTCASVPVPDYPAALYGTDSLKGLRLGLPREFTENDVLSPGMAAAVRKTTDIARDMGASLVDISLPHTDYAVAAYYIMAMAEAGSNLARYDGVRYGHRASGARDLDDLYTRSRAEGFGKEVQRRILLGAYVLSAGYYDAYYRKAAQVRRLIRRDFDQAFERCDAMLAPTSPIQAWPLGAVTDHVQMYQMDRFTLPLNMAGLPGLAIPVGLENGLPLGLQIIGRSFDEASILRIGHLLTSALGTAGQYAPM